ncbi:hypothetical protein [Candidatus Binatus sp.]|uniref:hypothetical protein n=1 Tax=Candidatus Binatus sp. TaxID=2811406 RepID=UPI003C73F298
MAGLSIGRGHPDATIRGERKIMRMKTAIMAFVGLALISAPLLQGVSFAQGAPAAMASTAMASSLSAADKDALIKKLQDAKAADKRARKQYSTEPLTQAGYDRKITQINRLLHKLNKGEDFNLSDADQAAAAPGKPEPN